MSEETIVRHCSPTLAGLKTGNLFRASYTSRRDMREDIRHWNAILAKKGLRVIPLRFQRGSALIYLYRPHRLENDLRDGRACALLQQRGYCTDTPSRCIAGLIQRLRETEEFPHEIGLFLGYPPEDVYGFIEHKDEGCKCVGFWKVYGDADAARRTFDRFRKCADVYYRQWQSGRPLERLAVNG